MFSPKFKFVFGWINSPMHKVKKQPCATWLCGYVRHRSFLVGPLHPFKALVCRTDLKCETRDEKGRPSTFYPLTPMVFMNQGVRFCG